MVFKDRADATRVPYTHAINAVMPYLTRGRNAAAVYYEKDIDVEHALRYIRQKNASLPAGSAERYSLFAYILAAAARTIAEKPALNNFIHRRAQYRHKEIALAFIVKKSMTEDAPEASAKVWLAPSDTLEDATAKITAAIAQARMPDKGSGETLARIVHALPGAKALYTALFRLLDRWNIAPAALIRNDPLFCSAYFANLGSLGLDAPFHHIFEWGTASIFVVLGKLEQREHGSPHEAAHRRHHITFKITVDERIADGMYFASAASLFGRLMAHPELLEKPAAPPSM